MLPSLTADEIVFATGRYTALHSGDVVIIWHQGMEKIKRIQAIDGDKLYVVGDNLSESTDSRTFGWLDIAAVQAKVIWPRR
jgi:hypothetical protein